MTDLSNLGIVDAAAAIRAGEITAENLADSLLARAAAHADLNAFIALDPERVRAAAREADRHGKSGDALGPLGGVPLALKDNIDTADLPTTAGTPGLRDNRPFRDAPIVGALRDAGAIMFGKCNMHELAFGITNNNAAFGPARNPYDPTRIPGGSSGGTAVAVAARLVPGGIGTDTGGSVRVPAALCGIVGFRPSAGRWSQAGIVPISHTRDTAGPIARSVADCALIDAIVTGEPTIHDIAPLKGLRLGVPRRHFWEGLDDELGQICAATLDCLRGAGVTLVEIDLSEAARLDAAAGFPIALHETVIDLGAYLADHGSALDFATLAARSASPDVNGLLCGLADAGAVPEAVYRTAIDVHRPALQEVYRHAFREHGIAAVIFPTTPAPAAAIGEDENFMINGVAVPTFTSFIRNCGPGSVAGIPGLSLPAGMNHAGLPIGIEIDGPAGSDRRLLAVGDALAMLLPPLPAPKLAHRQ
ncbi:MAG TPA: indoleacetamide hydrolase [Stellaceae bacterium]